MEYGCAAYAGGCSAYADAEGCVAYAEIPDSTLECIKFLDYSSEDLLVPTYLTAATHNSGSPDFAQETSLGNVFVQRLNKAF